MNDGTQTIARLAALTHELIAPLGDPRGGYALLDFPDYSNVGDSLIWLGELAYFDRHAGRPASYVCTTHDFEGDALRQALPEGPVYLSGGGNFGDIWPRFQQFRMAVMEATVGRPVIQLPQTILFRNDANAALTREAIARHGNFTLMVRDQRSVDYARAHLGVEPILAPDMAFSMGPMRPAVPVVRDTTYLVRTDQEAAADRGMAAPSARLDVLSTDWIRENVKPNFADRVRHKVARMVDTRSLERRFRDTAMAERERGMALLGAGRTVVTDRLHGHILSLLLRKPHVVVDNSYGKIGGFMDAWTGRDPIVHRASNFEEAARILDRII
ncbi:polysaccharide pyruvyl transferase family protein [Sphingobium xenophagum]|uniref:Pyruvyl transferase EpsO n=1 Tax=Sphingobium xenophagum TaxID=121428 RepID=A0A401J6G2_SPHXE|nr:polysaccharide pyruvyl transferase family protein [Sphingobium xenophagum]GBH32188.1 pyruvyl transferase EpsO [Sphingobium xenophagum]